MGAKRDPKILKNHSREASKHKINKRYQKSFENGTLGPSKVELSLEAVFKNGEIQRFKKSTENDPKMDAKMVPKSKKSDVRRPPKKQLKNNHPKVTKTMPKGTQKDPKMEPRGRSKSNIFYPLLLVLLILLLSS